MNWALVAAFAGSSIGAVAAFLIARTDTNRQLEYTERLLRLAKEVPADWPGSTELTAAAYRQLVLTRHRLRRRNAAPVWSAIAWVLAAVAVILGFGFPGLVYTWIGHEADLGLRIAATSFALPLLYLAWLQLDDL